MRKLMSIMVFLAVSLLTISMVSALNANTDVKIESIEINGDSIDLTNAVTLAVEEGQEIEVDVKLRALKDLNDLEIDGKISFEYESIQDSTDVFNMKANTFKTRSLTLDLPEKLDKDEYNLRLRIMDKNTGTIEHIVKLEIEPARHAVRVADVSFSPGMTIKAGRSLLTTVLLENFGEKTQKDVKVTVAVPELGISTTEYVDVVNHDGKSNVDREDVPEMFLQIPATTKAGDYEVTVTTKYDHYTREDVQSYTVKVVENEFYTKEDKVVLAMYPENQNVAAGSSATYVVGLTNAGGSSKSYVISTDAGEWGSVSASENLVILAPGQSKVVTLTLSAKENAVQGAKAATVVVSSGKDVLQTMVLKANVTPSQGSNDGGIGLRNGLEIALIVLVVLLIVVGLIIGFSRLRKDEEEETYY